MFCLIDCNNFYASCERLFRPDLRSKPIVVLSNNDGCVIARSNEAKVLGIAMGEPYFKIKALIKQHDVQVFSSNFALYGDLSQRVMSVIESAWPEVEIYSIDEAFLDLSTMPKASLDSFCIALQKLILKATGIPTSIGIGPTKTLAKLANHVAKKELKIPVFNITKQRHWLKQAAVGDVWGVGRQWRKKLTEKGIYTAYDLSRLNPHLVKKQHNVTLMRTVMELQGVACSGLEEISNQKSIISSKSFGEMQTHFSSLAEAISSHCARAGEKLRQQQLLAKNLCIFIRGNPYRQDLAQYTNSMSYQLVMPTDDTRIFIKTAFLCLEKIYKRGIAYKKVGVMLSELAEKTAFQLDLFSQPSEDSLEKKDQLMSLVDKLNTKFGSHTIKFAAEGGAQPWATRSDMRSPCYTTRWSDLPVVLNRT